MTCDNQYANNAVGTKASRTGEGGIGTHDQGVPSTLRLYTMLYAYGQYSQGVGLYC